MMSEVPLALKQGLSHELMNVKLIVLNDAEGAIDLSFEAFVSLIRAKVGTQGDARGLRCHAFSLHTQ
jgi:hypothetical protein